MEEELSHTDKFMNDEVETVWMGIKRIAENG